MNRKYVTGPGGERPVWASKRRLVEMGREEGRLAFAEKRLPIRMGNTTFDNAALDTFNSLTEASVKP